MENYLQYRIIIPL